LKSFSARARHSRVRDRRRHRAPRADRHWRSCFRRGNMTRQLNNDTTQG
jgi:hypothetical protein